MKVHIPQPLLSYTGGATELEAAGESLAALLAELDRRHPGLRFRIVDEQDRIRPHVRFFVNRKRVRELDAVLREGDEVHILQALSGG